MTPQHEPHAPPPGDTPGEVTRLLAAWRDGDAHAQERLVALVYDRVRAIAGASLRRQPGNSITPTELAHEALIRLLAADASWADRKHFFHVVAQATRQVLVDIARRRLADKRGGGVQPEPFEDALAVAAPAQEAELLRVNDALDALSREDARRAHVVELTYFGGLDREEVARSLDLSIATVDRDLRFARAWLKQALIA
jgi:RNA polymerase sigma factor (TIGR02999 family)